jgi:SAM-dependent methyltransferase
VSLDLLRSHLASGEVKRALVLGAGAEALREQLEPLCPEISGPAEGDLKDFGQVHESLPFEDESFDLVCALDILSEAEDDEAVVSELRRVLSPEGLLLDCGLSTERNTYANSLLFALIAPATLAARLVDAPSDQRLPMPRLANELCYQAFAAERFLSRHIDLPLGQTLVALARRRESTSWILPEGAKRRPLLSRARVQTACY